MKNKLLLAVTAMFFCNFSFAKIWRVNNNAGVTANFTTAQAANNSASVLAGDSIHLEPSSVSYGSLNCTKRLTWISTGAFLSIHPNQQFSQNAGFIDDITATQPGCANSVFHVNVNSNITIGVQGIRVDRTFAGGTIFIDNYSNTVTNTVIINCYARGYLSINIGTNHVIANNIFEGTIYVYATNNQAIITNNVFNAVDGTPGFVNNASLTNNIFNKTTSAYTFTNCTVQYNMSGAADVLPTGDNNQNNVDMTTVFVDNNGTTDAAFVLKPGSPAIGAGTESPAVDLGAFGGSSPFKLAMQPPIPSIYKIQAPVTPSGTTMNVIFSTKSNN